LHEYIAGIVIVNDISARDIQIPQTQFYKGKSYRTFGPVGPILCLLEEADMPYLKKLNLTLRVNKEIRQNDNTANLVFGPAETLTELSAIQNLMAGDLIATGTPAGCALSVPSPLKQRIAGLLPEKKKWEMFMRVQANRQQYLRHGDFIESTIFSDDGKIQLGTQQNIVVVAS
jgi:2-keto-4-pentenoate hydratase/2-oxohepta-3-ene-1,7-dioic acid hydratase in catechol pathway